MEPRYYSVDVHVGNRRLDDQRLLVVVDWSPAAAESTRSRLNALLKVTAVLNRAIGSDLREYSLRAFALDERGERTGRDPGWTWRYQPLLAEVDNSGWWQL